MSNIRYHSIGLKVKEKQESNPGRQSDDRIREKTRWQSLNSLYSILFKIYKLIKMNFISFFQAGLNACRLACHLARIHNRHLALELTL